MKILFPSAVSSWHSFYIVNAANEVLEGATSEKEANRVVKVLNDHETSNNRPPQYRHVPKPTN